MIPVYFIVGLINIFAQRNNYAIKDQPNGMDIRVRRSLPDPGLEPIIQTDNYENQLLDRPKRYAYYKKIKIPVNTQNSDYQSVNRNGGISGPGYNNNRPVIRSYPYGYPPGYEPRPATPGYKNTDNTPVYYNYQNPNGQSFAGYSSNTRRPVNYSPLTDMLASYPRNNDQSLVNNFKGSSGYNNSPLPNETPSNNVYGTPSNNVYGTPSNNVYGTPSNNNVYGTPSDSNNAATSVNSNIYDLPTTTTPSPVFNVTTPSQNTDITTTPRILFSCIICHIPCPEFMQRLGNFCVPDER